MNNTQFSLIVFVLFILLAALALSLICVLTDYWYIVKTDSTVNTTQQEQWNYNYGLWKKCYNDIPRDETTTDRVGNCVTIYQNLIGDKEESLSKDDMMYLHLSRSVVGFVIAMGAVQLAAVFNLLCGIWPGNCKAVRRAKLLWSTSLILLLATMCGIVSGISFIALRDIDRKDHNIFPDGVYPKYGWSFMVAWIATGLNLVDSFILLCLLKSSYDDINEIHKYHYYNMRD